jgi:hypothetical protein
MQIKLITASFIVIKSMTYMYICMYICTVYVHMKRIHARIHTYIHTCTPDYNIALIIVKHMPYIYIYIYIYIMPRMSRRCRVQRCEPTHSWKCSRCKVGSFWL